MAWRTLNTDDIRLTPAEIALLQNIQGSADVCSQILTNVIGEFREAIAAAGTTLGADGTVPDLVRLHVINRVRWLWLIEFPQAKAFQTEQRAAANTAAEKMLTSLLARETTVPSGETGGSTDASPAPAFGTRDGTRATDPAARRFNQTTQDGI